MFIYFVLLFLAALIFASQFFVTRQYQIRNGTGFLSSVKLSFFAYLTIAIFFFVKGCLTTGTLNFGFTWFTFGITLLIAVVSLSCVYMGIKVLAVGDMSIYSVFMMLGSIILPSFVDLVFYYAPEKLSCLKAVALGLMIIAIIFSISSVDKNKLTLKAILYYVGIFIMNGMIGVCFTIHQSQPELTAAVMQTLDGFEVNNDVFMTWYGISTVLLTGVIYGVCNFVKPIKSRLREFDEVDGGNEGGAIVEDKTRFAKSLLITIGLSAIYGLCNGVGDYFIAIATQPPPIALGASVAFPIINGGTIIFSTLSGVLFFKEKVTVSMVISLVIVVVSTVLFMFV